MKPEEVQHNLEEAVECRKEDQKKMEGRLELKIEKLEKRLDKNDLDHEELLQEQRKSSRKQEDFRRELAKLSPLVALADEKTIKYLKEGVELKRSTDAVMNTWKGRAKTIAIFLGVIAVILTIINAAKDLVLYWFINIKVK